MPSLLRRHWPVAAVFALALAADQLTKVWVRSALELGESWPRSGFFRITHVGNTGSALGLFSNSNSNSILIVLACVGVGVLLAYYRSHPSPGLLVKASLGLLLAGAIGNLLDRLTVGHVTDFIDVGPWYIFNVADSAIVCGVIALGVSLLLSPKEPRKPTGPLDTGDGGA
ncbi:MAG: signal peptidase II [Chloroflexota bacterium]